MVLLYNYGRQFSLPLKRKYTRRKHYNTIRQGCSKLLNLGGALCLRAMQRNENSNKVSQKIWGARAPLAPPDPTALSGPGGYVV